MRMQPRSIIMQAISQTLKELHQSEVNRLTKTIIDDLFECQYTIVNTGDIEELQEYFIEGADADLPSGGMYLPNEEMKHLVLLDEMAKKR